VEQFSKIFEKFVVEKSFLYLVSTPIGNLGDLSLRSIKTLQEVDYILCEDSRVTNKILSKLEIKNKNLISYNDFNSKNKRPVIINNLINKKCNYALVSDAGTPLISDPGFKLVKECLENNIKITHIPGPTSVISGLILSGLPTNEFFFGGFFEKNLNKRKKQLEKHKTIETTSIWFESSNRVITTLNLLLEIFGNRNISICRELTKLNEEIMHGTIKKNLSYLRKKNKLLGEIVLIISGYKKTPLNKKELKDLILKNIDKITTKDLSSELADKTGLGKNFIYNEILKIKSKKT